MRKGLKAAGAGVQGKQSKPSPQHPFPKIGKLISLWTTSGTTLLDQIRAKADPPKLLDRISTNQKDTVHKERSGSPEPTQPERNGRDIDCVSGPRSV
ncbi:hypothetical protein H4Q26_003949 [Puccinia striiformis f. sp. tritici PST-130]|nr:hypothetical protein H4Q26_003949 [Puccinia striiformis f. sp. tritici PST-130]